MEPDEKAEHSQFWQGDEGNQTVMISGSGDVSDYMKEHDIVADSNFFIVLLKARSSEFRQAVFSSAELRTLLMQHIGHVIRQLGDPEAKRAGSQKGGRAKVKAKGVHSAENGRKAQSEEARQKMREAWQRRKERAQQGEAKN